MGDILISVVMVVHDQAEQLARNLPLFLDVAEEANAEIIVVDDTSSDETTDLLQQMRGSNERLYSTFLPSSIVTKQNRLQLALSLGVKASKGAYVVFADICRPPVSVQWLTGLADGEAALVFSQPNDARVNHVVATELEDFSNIVKKAERKGTDGHKGIRMKIQRGLYDALSVKRKRAFDALKLFDQPIDNIRLIGLALSTWLRMS
jgi:hypothetical protein